MDRKPKLRNPLLTDLTQQLSVIKKELQSALDGIQKHRDTLDSLLSHKSDSKVLKLFEEKDLLTNEIKSLKDSREEIKNKINAISEQTKQQPTRKRFSTNSVNEEIASIEQKIILEKLTVKQENIYREKINSLKQKLEEIKALESKDSEIENLRNDLNELYDRKKQIQSTLEARNKELDGLKTAIDELKAQSKASEPVLRAKDDLQREQKKRDELLKQKKELVARINSVYDQHQNYLKLHEQALQHEEKIKETATRIHKLKKELDMLSKQQTDNTSQLDALIASLKKKTPTGSFTGGIVAALTNQKIFIPKNEAEMQKAIDLLIKRRSELLKENEIFKLKNKESIDKKNREISEAQAELDDLKKNKITLPPFSETASSIAE